MTTITERPILFQGEMVRAILKRRKFQTRRVMKPQPPPEAGDIEESEKYAGEFFYWLDGNDKSTSFTCPYGEPGSRLWVRESFRPYWSPWGGFGIEYVADDHVRAECSECPDRLTLTFDQSQFIQRLRAPFVAKINAEGRGYAGRNHPARPSIHMPRWASRIDLEILSVRAERVQDITEEDAVAEGVDPETLLAGRATVGERFAAYTPTRTGGFRKAYQVLWDSINARPKPVRDRDTGLVSHYVSYPWEEVRETRTHRGKPWHVVGNPWVWVVGFRHL